MGVFKVKQGDFQINTLICTRAAMMFIDSLKGLSQNSLSDTEANAVLLFDKTVLAIYFTHKAYCEDDDLPVTFKRSQVYDHLMKNSEKEGNLKKFMEEFLASMEDIKKQGKAKDTKKKSVTPTIN